jgi:GAF domain-containing protein
MQRPLVLADLARLGDALRAAGDPPPVFEAAEEIAAQTIGHRLFTINLFDAARFEVARAYSSQPAVYPVAGRKKKAHTAWGEHVLIGMQTFLAPDPATIRAAFDDHETVFSLGIGSILNIPVCFEGRCIGTMNLCHEAHWFAAEDTQNAQMIGAFLTAPLLKMQSQTV